MKKETFNYSLRLPMAKSMHDRIKVAAEKKGMSQNAFMRQILNNYLNHQGYSKI